MMADFNHDQSRGEAEVQRSDDNRTTSLRPQGSRQHNYKVIREIGRGSFGIVYKALNETTNELVAIKEADQSRRAVDLIAEADILSPLWHDNIVNLKDICGSVSLPHSLLNPALVLELGYCDLKKVLEHYGDKLESQHIKSITQQLFEGLHYIHGENIIHRDIKPENVMLTDCGTVKITDFGLASTFRPGKFFTPHVGTRMFHSPELLLGTSRVTTAVDMWAAGLTLFELFFRTCLFPRRATREGMLEEMARLLGTIDRSSMSDSSDLPDLDCFNLPKNDHNHLDEKLARFTSDRTAIQMFCGLLRLNPDTRLSADSALSEPFFACHPLPQIFLISNIPGFPASPPYAPAQRLRSSRSTPPLVIDCPGVSSLGPVPDIAHEVSAAAPSSRSNTVSAVSSRTCSDDHVSDIVEDDVQTSSSKSNTVSSVSSSAISDDHVPVSSESNVASIVSSTAFSGDHGVQQVSPRVEPEPKVIVEQMRPAPEHELPSPALSALLSGVNSMASYSILSSDELQNIPPEPQLARPVFHNDWRRHQRAQPLSPQNRRYHPYFPSK